MCGIAGLFYRDGRPAPEYLVEQMTDLISHRGPDDAGCYCSGPVGLGHRRLSIIDLSSAGHQPMTNEDGSLWLVFNGEVYNHDELRNELVARGHRFRSRTDSEVILHAYEEWGEDCVRRFNGMWGFALWDARRQLLFCSRDHFGIKPFYYSLNDRELRFASEIKAVLVGGDQPPGAKYTDDL